MDPHAEWIAAYTELAAQTAAAAQEERNSELYERLYHLARKICNAPATSFEGMSAQIEQIQTGLRVF